MFTMVALGAFGAHALEPTLKASGHQETWNTAVLYQAIHGLALLAIGIWQAVDVRAARAQSLRAAGWLWTAGVFTFCGSLYALSLGGPRWLGPVTPLGGLCFLAGWTALAIGAARLGRQPSPSA